jgi:hypothetical protein
MLPDSYIHDEEPQTNCTWCGEMLHRNAMPQRSAGVFCSRRCEIEGNFWLFQEMCAIEITHPQQSAEGHCDSP